MDFKDFIKEGIIRRASKDESLAKSLFKNSIDDLKFLDKLQINQDSSRRLMTNYYDILRSILEAISSMKGYKIYSHEAFTSFLKELKEEVLSIKFDRFRKIRNSINYYGKNISVGEAKDNIENIKGMIKILIKKYLGEFENG